MERETWRWRDRWRRRHIERERERERENKKREHDNASRVPRLSDVTGHRCPSPGALIRLKRSCALEKSRQGFLPTGWGALRPGAVP